jgi:hypothetical protein
MTAHESQANKLNIIGAQEGCPPQCILHVVMLAMWEHVSESASWRGGAMQSTRIDFRVHVHAVIDLVLSDHARLQAHHKCSSCQWTA